MDSPAHFEPRCQNLTSLPPEVAGLGISWTLKYSWLSSTGSLDHISHLGLQLGGTLHHQSPALMLFRPSHQMLGAGRTLHGMTSFLVIWA